MHSNVAFAASGVKNIQWILRGRVEADDAASPPSCTLNPLIIFHQTPLAKQTPNTALTYVYLCTLYRDKHTLNESVLLIIMIHVAVFHFSWTAVNVSKELTCTRFNR